MARHPPDESPLGLRVLVSGSAQSLPLIPWIAFVDPEVTKTAREGLYVVYLYDHAVRNVYLSMNQGATQHQRQALSEGFTGVHADRKALSEIAIETSKIRSSLDPRFLRQFLSSISLGPRTFLPVAYEAGNIAALRFEIANLPPSARLARDLQLFTELYTRCVESKDVLAAEQSVSTSARSRGNSRTSPTVRVFKPKNSGEYLASVAAGTQRRERRHEALIEAFGRAVFSSGRSAATNVHPRDLVVEDKNIEWLVEAKTVGLNGLFAVEGVVGGGASVAGRGRGLPRMEVPTPTIRKTPTCVTLPSPALT